ncbi:unnamed protein product [Acanthocheilonema viteae]|uniref:Uncharacterized protein n=1 Tax=Acanthocheilonema viteae TaxID=6277 RepID=A0A498S8F1_ACAVI|nr:unnamed protein product [Acanthocheilonema viteae]
MLVSAFSASARVVYRLDNRYARPYLLIQLEWDTVMMILDDEYMDEEKRYLEAGIEDCKNTAELIESFIVILEGMKCELQAQVEHLEARQFERTNFIKMVEVIGNVTKKTQRLQITANTSSSNQSSTFKQAQRKPNKTLVEKLCRPPASLTGSFTIDQDDDTITFLEPVRALTLQDTTMDDTVKDKDNMEQITDSLKKDVELAHISEPPAVESELAKQWIREVAFKQAQRKPTETFIEKSCRPLASLTGSFTVDQDEDTETFLEPMRALTFQDTTMDDIVKGKDNMDQITDNFKKKDAGPVRISEPPVMESELAKQWIREVAFKQDQDKNTVTFLEPVRVLTSRDKTMDDIVRGKGNMDQITKGLKKDVGPSVHTSESPIMESELAKQWIREVAQKM